MAAQATVVTGADTARKTETPLERYVSDAMKQAQRQPARSAGSTWSPGVPLGDLTRDLKANQINDLVTILVSERASAVAKGVTNTARKSSAKNSIAALAGPTRALGPLSDLASLSGDTKLQGQGETSRESTLTATLTARVVEVLPNGYLVVEGVKDTMVNSERQLIVVRGVVRPFDVTPGNVVRSDRISQMEVRVNGKGVVGDAIRRPVFLYRLLLGILPF